MRFPCSSAKGRQMRNAGIEIPRVTSVAEDFVHAVAKDEQARAGRNWQAELEILRHEAHPSQAGGRKKERIRLARKQHNRGGMTASGPSIVRLTPW